MVLDVGGRDEPLSPDIFPYLFVLSPNETELSRITGMPTDSTEQVIAAARFLQTKGRMIRIRCHHSCPLLQDFITDLALYCLPDCALGPLWYPVLCRLQV